MGYGWDFVTDDVRNRILVCLTEKVCVVNPAEWQETHSMVPTAQGKKNVSVLLRSMIEKIDEQVRKAEAVQSRLVQVMDEGQ